MRDDGSAAAGTGPSLAGRALAAGRGLRGRLREAGLKWPRLMPARGLTPRGVAIALPAMILASGTVTAVGAQLLADAHRRAAAAIAGEAEPLIRARRAAAARSSAAAADRALFEGPTISAMLERLARDLPDGAQIASLAHAADGKTRIGLLTADPDRLRGSAALSGFRQLDQRRDDSGRILVLLEARR